MSKTLNKINKLSEFELVKKLKEARKFYNSLLDMGYSGNDENMHDLRGVINDIKGQLRALRGRYDDKK